MIAHLAAVKTHLGPLGYTAHLVWAPEVTGQYLVLGGRAWERPRESPLSGLTDDLDTDLRITAVTGTPEGASIMLARVRALLSPQLDETRVPMAGRDVRVRFERSEFLTVDQDQVITGTSRHPAVGVDTYRLTSQPSP